MGPEVSCASCVPAHFVQPECETHVQFVSDECLYLEYLVSCKKR